MTPDELKRNPSYPELLARFVALEQRFDVAENTSAPALLTDLARFIELTTDRLIELEQQVRDLTAQLAAHEAAPFPHIRYTIHDLGVIVADGLDAALADYDPRDEMDVPITDDAQADACELTAEQRARIMARVKTALNGNGA